MRARRYLFVYGSLMPGEEAFPLLAPFVGEQVAALTPGRLVCFGRYPGLRPGEGWVRGVLVALAEPEAAFAALDPYEGYFGDGHPANAYVRTEIPVRTTEGWRRAEAYLAVTAFGATPVPDGDWRLFRQGLVAVARPKGAGLPARRLDTGEPVCLREARLAELSGGGGEVVPLEVVAAGTRDLRSAVLLDASEESGCCPRAPPRGGGARRWRGG